MIENKDKDNTQELEKIEENDMDDPQNSDNRQNPDNTQNSDHYRSYKIRNKDKSNKLRRNLIIIALIIGGLILFGFVAENIKELFFPGEEDYTANGPYIATLYVEGTIAAGQTDEFGFASGYQHQWTLDRMDELMEDNQNKGLIIFIDSPGGGVYESDELYMKLKEYKEYTDRPIYAVMGSMAASGGYYIAAAADEIIASRNTWTGSIGVTIGTLYDFSELLDKYGVKSVTITAGENKSMGSLVEPLTKEQQDIFQGLVDEAYDQFVGIVSEERNLSLEETKKIADGRIYTAKQALNLGLIDGIGTKKDAGEQLKEKYDLQNSDIIDIIYTDNSFFSSLFGSVEIPDFKGSDVSSLLEIIRSENQFPISYQCELLPR